MCLQVPVKSPLTDLKHTCPFRDGLYTCRAVKHWGQSEREWSGTRWAGVISADCSRGKTRARSHISTHIWNWSIIPGERYVLEFLLISIAYGSDLHNYVNCYLCSWALSLGHNCICANHLSCKLHLTNNSKALGKLHNDEADWQNKWILWMVLLCDAIQYNLCVSQTDSQSYYILWWQFITKVFRTLLFCNNYTHWYNNILRKYSFTQF